MRPGQNTKSDFGLILRILAITALYIGLSQYGGVWGWKLLYPVRLFVTFLHEFGHAIGAILTDGHVEQVQISRDGGGVTRTRGGNRAVILMGGYLGSVFFGNLLFYVGARGGKAVKPTLGLVIIAMGVTGFFWFDTLFTTAVLIGFSGFIFFAGLRTSFGRDILMVLGLASIFYIIQDTGNGPRSDLAGFETEMRFIPAWLWMYIWLGIALMMGLVNIRLLLRRKPVR